MSEILGGGFWPMASPSDASRPVRELRLPQLEGENSRVPRSTEAEYAAFASLLYSLTALRPRVEAPSGASPSPEVKNQASTPSVGPTPGVGPVSSGARPQSSGEATPLNVNEPSPSLVEPTVAGQARGEPPSGEPASRQLMSAVRTRTGPARAGHASGAQPIAAQPIPARPIADQPSPFQSRAVDAQGASLSWTGPQSRPDAIPVSSGGLGESDRATGPFHGSSLRAMTLESTLGGVIAPASTASTGASAPASVSDETLLAALELGGPRPSLTWSSGESDQAGTAPIDAAGIAVATEQSANEGPSPSAPSGRGAPGSFAVTPSGRDALGLDEFPAIASTAAISASPANAAITASGPDRAGPALKPSNGFRGPDRAAARTARREAPVLWNADLFAVAEAEERGTPLHLSSLLGAGVGARAAEPETVAIIRVPASFSSPDLRSTASPTVDASTLAPPSLPGLGRLSDSSLDPAVAKLPASPVETANGSNPSEGLVEPRPSLGAMNLESTVGGVIAPASTASTGASAPASVSDQTPLAALELGGPRPSSAWSSGESDQAGTTPIDAADIAVATEQSASEGSSPAAQSGRGAPGPVAATSVGRDAFGLALVPPSSPTTAIAQSPPNAASTAFGPDSAGPTLEPSSGFRGLDRAVAQIARRPAPALRNAGLFAIAEAEERGTSLHLSSLLGADASERAAEPETVANARVPASLASPDLRSAASSPVDAATIDPGAEASVAPGIAAASEMTGVSSSTGSTTAAISTGATPQVEGKVSVASPAVAKPSANQEPSATVIPNSGGASAARSESATREVTPPTRKAAVTKNSEVSKNAEVATPARGKGRDAAPGTPIEGGTALVRDTSGSNSGSSASTSAKTPRVTLAELPERFPHVVRLALDAGRREARIQLMPPDLGTIQVRLRMNGRAVSAVMTVEREEVRALVAGLRDQLRDQLEQAGLKLERLEVITGRPAAALDPAILSALPPPSASPHSTSSESRGQATEERGRGSHWREQSRPGPAHPVEPTTQKRTSSRGVDVRV